MFTIKSVQSSLERGPDGLDGRLPEGRSRWWREGDMIDELHEEMKASMQKSVEALQKDLKRIRTGRASLALLDGIMVDYYGSLLRRSTSWLHSPSPSRGRSLFSLGIPRQWQDIEKALLKSELGLTPMNDGKIIQDRAPDTHSGTT